MSILRVFLLPLLPLLATTAGMAEDRTSPEPYTPLSDSNRDDVRGYFYLGSDGSYKVTITNGNPYDVDIIYQIEPRSVIHSGTPIVLTVSLGAGVDQAGNVTYQDQRSYVRLFQGREIPIESPVMQLRSIRKAHTPYNDMLDETKRRENRRRREASCPPSRPLSAMPTHQQPNEGPGVQSENSCTTEKERERPRHPQRSIATGRAPTKEN